MGSISVVDVRAKFLGDGLGVTGMAVGGDQLGLDLGDRLGGAEDQFSTGVKSSMPLPTTVAIMCLLMSEKSGAVPNNDCIIAQDAGSAHPNSV